MQNLVALTVAVLVSTSADAGPVAFVNNPTSFKHRTALSSLSESRSNVCNHKFRRFTVPRMALDGATLEKSKGVSPAILPQKDSEKQKEKPYHVMLFNDPINTREYVCGVLIEVFGHSKSQAYDIMQTAHSQGFAVCNTTNKDEADAQSSALLAARLMSSVVEAD